MTALYIIAAAWLVGGIAIQPMLGRLGYTLGERLYAVLGLPGVLVAAAIWRYKRRR